VILSPSRVVELCTNPAAAAHIRAGRELEKQHRLHLEGTPDLLESFIDSYQEVMTPESRQNLKKVAVAATKPLFGSYRDILFKIFTARGTTFYYEFDTPELEQEFNDYLDTLHFLPRLRQKFSKVSLMGFQGVFLVDLPNELNPADELPAPYWKYIPSKLIHDALVTGDTYEYVIIKQGQKQANGTTVDYFVCFDDEAAHVVVPGSNGMLAYSEERTVFHELGYVPAFAPSLFAALSDNDTTRTSIFDTTLPVATSFLRDHMEHELQKKYHAFSKMWSYAIDCEYMTSTELPQQSGCTGPAQYVQVACEKGHIQYPDGQVRQCPNCRGRGKFIPTGPDKVYMLSLPKPGVQGTQVDIRPPAGYIVPDVETLEKQAQELERGEKSLEKAALGKEGILASSTKVESGDAKSLDMQPVYDRLRTFSASWQHVIQGVAETMARLRYGSSFRRSSVNIGDKYQLKTPQQLEQEYEAAKKAGIDDGQLFGYLEEVIYTKYKDDPLELEYNRLKLHLTPMPTRSTAELQQWLAGATVPNPKLVAAFERKLNLNDYVARFERENGPLVQFGTRLPFDKRISKIQETFKIYDNESEPVHA
jgi:hypothetical protein